MKHTFTVGPLRFAHLDVVSGSGIMVPEVPFDIVYNGR